MCFSSKPATLGKFTEAKMNRDSSVKKLGAYLKPNTWSRFEMENLIDRAVWGQTPRL